MKWIGQCGSIAAGWLYHYDHLHKNTSTYFLRINRTFQPHKETWGYSTAATQLLKDVCFYLGTYHNFWNPYNRKIVWAHNLESAWIADPTSKGYREAGPMRSIFEKELGKITSEGYRPPENLRELIDTGVQAMTTTPFVPQREIIDYDKKTLQDVRDIYGTKAITDFFHPELLDRADATARAGELASRKAQIENALWEISEFYTQNQVSSYYDMWAALEARERHYQNCIAQNYPQKSIVPQKKTPTPAGPANWPGEPLEKMERPGPQKPYLTTSGTLTTWLSISEDPQVSALELTIWYEDSEAAKEAGEAFTFEEKPSGTIPL